MWRVDPSSVPGRPRRVFIYQTSAGLWVSWPGGMSAPQVAGAPVAFKPASEAEPDPAQARRICAPMTSRLIVLAVREDQEVAVGDLIAVVEAMKMEFPLTSQIKGRVATIHHQAPNKVNRGDLIVTLSPLDVPEPPAQGALQ